MPEPKIRLNLSTLGDLQSPETFVGPLEQPVMRAPTWSERLSSIGQDIYEELANTLPGQFSDALGLTGFRGVAQEMATPQSGVQMSIVPPVAGAAEAAAAIPSYRSVAPEFVDRMKQLYGVNAGRATYGTAVHPRLSLVDAEAAGLWHPIGDNKRLSVPVDAMQYRSTPDPNVTMVPKRTMSLDELAGAALVPAPGDRTAAGTIVSEIGGRKIDPVYTEGGVDFMRTHDPHGAVWASKQNAAVRLQNRIGAAAAESIKQGGTGEVYLVYMPLSHGTTDFSSMMSDAVLAQVQAGGVSSTAAKQFDSILRKTRPEWKGLYHPEARAQLLGNGELRHAFIDTVSLDRFTPKQGFPDLPTTRAAITRPDLMDTPILQGGQGVAKVSGDIVANPVKPHTTYNTQLAGKYAGEFEHTLPLRQMFSDWAESRRAAGRPELGDPRSFMLGHPVQVATPRWIERNVNYLKSIGAALVPVAVGEEMALSHDPKTQEQ